jgi:hypothetical protein
MKRVCAARSLRHSDQFQGVAVKNWIGKWLVAVSVLHTAFAVVAYGKVYASMAASGIVGSGLRSPLNSAASWFLLFGLLTLALGLVASAFERTGQSLPRAVGVVLLALAALGVVLMPASGFWLVLPPALALLWPRRPVAARALA